MWFAARDLLAEVDVDPESLMLTDGFVSFETKIATVFCAQDRCQFGTGPNAPTPDIIRDLVSGTFELLRETPIWELGLNHFGHIPREVRPWDDVVAQLGDPQKSFELLPGGQELTPAELKASRDDDHVGDRTVQLQPSLLLEGGTWFTLNDHFVVHPQAARASVGAGDAVKILDEVWDSSRALADQVHDRLAP